jgi:hypothetical protein
MAIFKGSIAAVKGRAIIDQLKADTEALGRHRCVEQTVPSWIVYAVFGSRPL